MNRYTWLRWLGGLFAITLLAMAGVYIYNLGVATASRRAPPPLASGAARLLSDGGGRGALASDSSRSSHSCSSSSGSSCCVGPYGAAPGTGADGTGAEATDATTFRPRSRNGIAGCTTGTRDRRRARKRDMRRSRRLAEGLASPRDLRAGSPYRSLAHAHRDHLVPHHTRRPRQARLARDRGRNDPFHRPTLLARLQRSGPAKPAQALARQGVTTSGVSKARGARAPSFPGIGFASSSGPRSGVEPHTSGVPRLAFSRDPTW